MLTPICAAAVVVHTSWGRERIADAAVEAIRTELGLRATLEHVDVSVFPTPHVRADGIVLDDPVYGRFAEADSLTIRPSLFAFLRGEIDLDEIEVEGPVLHLVLRDGEIRNLPRVRGGPSGGDDLPFSELIVHGAGVTLDADMLGEAMLEGVTIEIDVEDGRELDISVNVQSGRWEHLRGSERLRELHATAHVDPDEGIDLEELVFHTPHLEIDVEDGYLPLPPGPGMKGTVRVRANLARLRHLPHALDLPDLGGAVETSGTFEWTEDGPRGEGTLLVDHARVEQYDLGEMDLRYEVAPNEIRITRGTAKLIRDGGEVNITGNIGLVEGVPIALRLGIHDLQFAKLLEQLGVTPNAIVQWGFDGRIRIGGTLDPLDLRGPIAVETHDFLVTQDAYHVTPARRIIGVERAAVRGVVSVRPDALRFERLVADTPRSRIHADVMLGFHNELRVLADSPAIDLADCTPLIDIELGGSTRTHVDVSGTYQDPQVHGEVAIAGFALHTFPLGDVETSFRLEEGGLAARFPMLAAQKGESSYTVQDLFLDFRDDRFTASGALHTERMTLADFYQVFHFENDERFADYAALFSGDAAVRYTLGHPTDRERGTMTADLDLAIAEASIGDYEFTDGVLRASYVWLDPDEGIEGGELAIDQFTLEKGGGTLSIDGRMAEGGRLDMTLAADRIALSDTEGIADRLPDLDGVVGMYGRISGTTDLPHADLDVMLSGVSWGASMLGDARAYVKLTDQDDPYVRAAEAWDPNHLPDEPCAAARSGLARARYRPDPPYSTPEGPVARLSKPMGFLVCGEALDGRVAVDLAIGKTLEYPIRGEVAIRELALDPILREIDEDEPLDGRLSARARFTDGSLIANTLSGRVTVSELDVGQGDVRLRNDGLVDVILDDGNYRIGRARFTGPSSSVELRGSGSAQHGLAVEIDGRLDLGILASLTPDLTRAAGNVDVEMRVTGPFESPGIYGEATISDGGFRYVGFPEPLTDLDGTVTFSARRLILENMTAHMGGGTLALSGSAALRGRGLDRYDLSIEARDVSLRPEPGVDLTIGGLATLSWADGQRLPQLGGTLRLERVLYTKPIQLSLGDLSRPARTQVEEYDPAEDHVEMDLRVVQDTPMRISNNLIDAEVAVEDSERPFRIVGTDQRQGAIGSLTIPRGVVYFRGASFVVRRGRIDFEDPRSFDPTFDVQAIADVRRSGDLSAPSWRITLAATGNGDSFRLDTRSEPELSQEDIVFLLTVGMTRAEAEQLQAGDVASTVALEALTSFTGIDRELQRAVPVIDDFSITTRYSTNTNRTEPQITIGKRINDRVRITASTGVSDSSNVRASVEWRLGENTSVQAAYDNFNAATSSGLGNVGVDVRWRLEFE